MLDRQDVIDLYQLILDRLPESDQVINEKRRSASLSELAADMFASEEFIARNQQWLRDLPSGMSSAPVLRVSWRQRILRRLVAAVLKTSAGQSLKQIARSEIAAGAR